jgi:hypothetical protein
LTKPEKTIPEANNYFCVELGGNRRAVEKLRFQAEGKELVVRAWDVNPPEDIVISNWRSKKISILRDEDLFDVMDKSDVNTSFLLFDASVFFFFFFFFFKNSLIGLIANQLCFRLVLCILAPQVKFKNDLAEFFPKLRIQDIEPDGACLFSSIAFGLWARLDSPAPAIVRALIVEHMVLFGGFLNEN